MLRFTKILIALCIFYFFFFDRGSCTNGKIASTCQLCDGYCYNGGTCQLDPETNIPVCL